MDLMSNLNLHTGRSMPVMGLGSWQLKDDTADVIAEALRLGYRLIDTSGDYGTQPGIAEGIKKSRLSRDSFYIVTKVEEDDDAYAATERNLHELELSYADLMLIHRPPEVGAGQALWDDLIRAKRDGLTQDIGVSNYSIDQIETLIEVSGEVPTVNQIEWSPFGHSKEMLDYCNEHDIIIQAYSPLTRAKQLSDQTVAQLAADYRKTPAQLLIRWNLQLGTVPLPKANKLEHLVENIEVFDFEISPTDMDRLSQLNEGYSSLEKLPYM